MKYLNQTILIITITIFFICNCVLAQTKPLQTAITTDGRKVTLKDDGTWEYQSEPQNSLSSSPLENVKMPEGTISITYDKFEDKTKVSGFIHIGSCATETMLYKHTDISAIYFFQGTKAKTPDSIYLSIFSGVKIFNYNSQAFIIADGKRHILGTMKVTDIPNKEVRGFYYQALAVSIPFQTFEAIANAKQIEMKVGNVEIAGNKIELQKILPVFKKMSEQIHAVTNQ